MRLLNTHNYRFKEFVGDPPDYYILSHTWFSEEPAYQQFLAAGPSYFDSDGAIPDFPGLRKIKKFCELARARGCEWVWVDTCCINKESSAELSEAINSMYRYYEGARVCIVYLSDVSSRAVVGASGGEGGDVYDDNENNNNVYYPDDGDGSGRNLRVTQGFAASRWFRRGWTLQELLAPAHVEFYDMEWRPLGDKRHLKDIISRVTGISGQILRSRKPASFILKTSVGVRMSWAANRKTTRVEDAAYCLLGIFGINMYLLYGEGPHAFLRLQRKILKRVTDETMFAWNLRDSPLYFSGFLAPHPSAFEGAERIRESKMSHSPMIVDKENLTVSVFNAAHLSPRNTSVVLPLNCCEGDSDTVVGVLLTNLHGTWYRRANVGLVRVGQADYQFPLFRVDHQPNETLTVPMSMPPSSAPLGGMSLGVPLGSGSKQALPVSLRFVQHYLDADALLASLDPWELYQLSCIATASVDRVLGHYNWLNNDDGTPADINTKSWRVARMYPDRHPFRFAARLLTFLAHVKVFVFDNRLPIDEEEEGECEEMEQMDDDEVDREEEVENEEEEEAASPQQQRRIVDGETEAATAYIDQVLAAARLSGETEDEASISPPPQLGSTRHDQPMEGGFI